MRWTVGLWLGVCVTGCLRDPDPGGQEGEEVRNLGAVGEDAGGEGGGQADSGSPTDEGDTGSAETDDGVDASGWTGTLVVERGAGSDPEARDCVLLWVLDGGTSADDCASCDAVFDVEHTFDASGSVGREACADLPDQFARTYGIERTSADTVRLWTRDGSGAFSPYANASLVDGRLDWTVGFDAVPSEDADAGTVYRTDLESGSVTLD